MARTEWFCICLTVEPPQIGLPLVEPIQRIVAGTQVCRRGLASSRAIEHPAQRYAINNTRDGPQGPTMRGVYWSITTSTQCVRRTADSQRNRLKLQQTVLRVTEDREPGRVAGVCALLIRPGRMIVSCDCLQAFYAFELLIER